MSASPLSTEVSEGIGRLTLDRPDKRNALTIELRDELTGTLGEWAVDEEVRVVVISGAGAAFCAGFDLDQFAQAELARDIFRSSASYHRALWWFGKPTIAAVNGPAMGGGFDLSVLC